MKQPTNTAEFLEALKAARRLPTDYALAKHYGINTQTVSSYRTGRTVPDDAMGVRIAQELNLDPGYVLAQLAAERAERAKNDALAQTWHAIARRFGVAASLVLAAFFLPALFSVWSIDAAQGAPLDQSVYYVKSQLAFWISAYLIALVALFDPQNQQQRGQYGF